MSRRPPDRPSHRASPIRHHSATGGETVRGLAAWVVERTLSTLSPSAVFLDSALGRCDELDHGLLRTLSLGTLRWLRRIDHVLAAASHRPLAAIEPVLQAPLRIGAYQLLFLDRVPDHAVVHEAVEHARRLTHRGGASFTNAVLRRIARSPRLADWPVEEDDPLRRLAIESSHPDFLVARWNERFGAARTASLVDANNRPKSLQLLAFRGRGGRELLAEALIDDGIEVEPSALSPVGLLVRSGNPLRSAAFASGLFYLQDEASQAAALLPPPRPGERILDAAASPGGKSFTLVAHQPGLRPVAADVAPERLRALRSNLRRLALDLPCLLADAATPPLRERSFDRVILDLPCTGTGTLRKHPELKWRISEGEIGRLSRQAGRLLDGVAPLVAVGGLLVAITCSLEAEENEDVVAAFLARRPEFAPLDLAPLVAPPVDRWIFAPGAWRIFPGGEHDGFTVHVLRRHD